LNRVTAWPVGARIVSGDSALAAADRNAASANAAAAWLPPDFRTATAWTPIPRVADFHDSATITAQVQLFPNGNDQGSDGAVKTISVSIPAGGHVGIDALAEIGEEEWVGYASVTADGPVGVLAHRSKPAANMAITNVAV